MALLNFKCRKPHWGQDRQERFFFVLSMIALLLGFIELPGLITYLDFFSKVQDTRCCGLIKQESYELDGAVCHEEDFNNDGVQAFGTQDINGSIYCVVDGQICDQFDDGAVFGSSSSSIEQCLVDSQYSASDLCGTDSLNGHTQIHTTVIALALTVLLLTSLHITLECVGCYDDSSWCASVSRVMMCKVCEIGIWLCLLLLTTVYIENAAGNGYVVTSYSSLEEPQFTVLSYMDDTCSFEDATDYNILWIDYDDDVNDLWVASPAYNAVAVLGLVVTALDFVMFVLWDHCVRRKKAKQELQAKTQETVTPDQVQMTA